MGRETSAESPGDDTIPTVCRRSLIGGVFDVATNEDWMAIAHALNEDMARPSSSPPCRLPDGSATSRQRNWELRIRRDQETHWRLARARDLDCGALTAVLRIAGIA